MSHKWRVLYRYLRLKMLENVILTTFNVPFKGRSQEITGFNWKIMVSNQKITVLNWKVVKIMFFIIVRDSFPNFGNVRQPHLTLTITISQRHKSRLGPNPPDNRMVIWFKGLKKVRYSKDRKDPSDPWSTT